VTAHLSIDPGRDTGWALWASGGRLIACGLGDGWPVHTDARVLIERPQVYRAAMSKGDPNDLITLAIQVGRYTERLESAGAHVEHVLPRDWKGTIDANVMLNRIIRDMSPEQATTVLRDTKGIAKSRTHNVIDAVGLGQWAFRRGRWA
jgi:hypothetical protein